MGLGEAGDGDLELLIGRGCFAFQLVQFSVSKDLPPVALPDLGLGLGNFPAIRRSNVRWTSIRNPRVGRRNSCGFRALVIRADLATSDNGQCS